MLALFSVGLSTKISEKRHSECSDKYADLGKADSSPLFPCTRAYCYEEQLTSCVCRDRCKGLCSRDSMLQERIDITKRWGVQVHPQFLSSWQVQNTGHERPSRPQYTMLQLLKTLLVHSLITNQTLTLPGLESVGRSYYPVIKQSARCKPKPVLI